MFISLLLSERGPAVEEDSIDMDRVRIGRRWQRVGQSQRFLASLCIFYERPAEQTVFLLVVRQTAYFERDFRRVIVASLNSGWCRAEMLLVRWRSNQKRNKDLSPVCKFTSCYSFCPWLKKTKQKSFYCAYVYVSALALHTTVDKTKY